MSKKYYNKLVRDKIPDILETKELEYSIHTASDDEFIYKLQKKLLEEVNEYLNEPCIEELADIYTVMNQLVLEAGVSPAELQEAIFKKNQDRGSFHRRVILEYVVDKEVG